MIAALRGGPEDGFYYQSHKGRTTVGVLDAIDVPSFIVRDGVLQIHTPAVQEAAIEVVGRIWATLPSRLERFEEVAPILRRLEKAVAQLPLGFRRSCCW